LATSYTNLRDSHQKHLMQEVFEEELIIQEVQKRRVLQPRIGTRKGVQYCSADYVNILQGKNIKISMTENGDPLENALLKE
jgi:hypothetical protein